MNAPCTTCPMILSIYAINGNSTYPLTAIIYTNPLCTHISNLKKKLVNKRACTILWHSRFEPMNTNSNIHKLHPFCTAFLLRVLFLVSFLFSHNNIYRTNKVLYTLQYCILLIVLYTTTIILYYYYYYSIISYTHWFKSIISVYTSRKYFSDS